MSEFHLPPCLRQTTVGGQAIIEGISMKGPKETCVAVRKPDGELVFKMRPTRKPTSGFWKLPVARGAYTLFQAMKEGVDDINYSASFIEDDDPNYQPSRFEKWLESKISSEKLEKILMGISLVIGIALPVVLFMLTPTLIIGLLPEGIAPVWRSLCEGLVRIVLFLLFMWGISHTKDIERTFRYHGAEHKTIFCYEAGLELTVDNVRTMPRFHPRCGTSFLFVVMIIPILIFAFVQMDNALLRMALRLALLPLIVGLSYEFNRYASKHDNKLTNALRLPGLYMQKLTVFEPDDGMMELAIEAMKRVIVKEDEM